MERIGCRRRPRPSGKGGRWYNPPGMVLARYSVQTTGGIGKERPLRGGDLLIECLKAQGVRAVFGMPGTQNLEIYDSLLRCGEGSVDHYLVRHEYAATQMADGFARSTGEVGVALTVPGPGASNASTGILEAYTDCVPVLLITGQSDSRFYDKHQAKMFHGLD
ncbi:MAG: thiamine pyrophosphate-binding protein, partial [Acidobacteria bacterium]|nr:thiamine pyrophosphate-binding protein [Acidobacteriota bacterium]